MTYPYRNFTIAKIYSISTKQKQTIDIENKLIVAKGKGQIYISLQIYVANL